MQQGQTALEREEIIDLLEKMKTNWNNWLWGENKVLNHSSLPVATKLKARDNNGTKHKSSSDIFFHMQSMWQALTGWPLLKKRLFWWMEVFWSHKENPAACQHIMHMVHVFIKLLPQELCKKRKKKQKEKVILNSQLALQQSSLSQIKEEIQLILHETKVKQNTKD